MNIPYKQLAHAAALRTYCDWLLEQQTDDHFFRCMKRRRQLYEWYMIFYPVRTLLMGGKILKDDKYIYTALKYIDLFLTEQLPNGAFTSNYRKYSTVKLTKRCFCGSVHRFCRFVYR